MYTQETPAFPKLAYSIENLALATDVGRSSIYLAIKVGELKSFNPIIDGKKLKRTLVSPEAAQKWVDGFQKPSHTEPG